MENILKDSAVPLHAQLAELLRTQIRCQKLQSGEQIPSERELCERYEISRITVRRALSTLAQEGLVYATVGKGTYVAMPRLKEELQPLSSFTEDMQRRGMAASSRVLEAKIILADEEWAVRLGVPRGEELVRLRRLRLADGHPVAVQLTHLPHHLCSELLRFDFSQHSLFDVLRTEYGLRMSRTTTVLRAALVKPAEGRLLHLTPPAAVLISEQTTYLDSGVVIEHAQSIFHGERYQLTMQV
jgi:GntR family transcriptional regulator